MIWLRFYSREIPLHMLPCCYVHDLISFRLFSMIHMLLELQDALLSMSCVVPIANLRSQIEVITAYHVVSPPSVLLVLLRNISCTGRL
jgi:hypothetical protein